MYTKTNVVVKCWFNLLTIFLDTEQLTSSTFMQLLKKKKLKINIRVHY